MICDRCDGPIHEGAVHYLVEIGVTGEMDAAPLGLLSSVELSLGLQRALEVASRHSEEELLAGVHERLAFVLCAPCRDAYRANPLGRPLPGSSGLIH